MALRKFYEHKGLLQKDSSFTEVNPSQSCHDDSTISVSVAVEQKSVKLSKLEKDISDSISGMYERRVFLSDFTFSH